MPEEIQLDNNHFNFKDKTGHTFLTNEGYVVRIIDYKGYHDCTIKFNDEFNSIRTGISYFNLKTGGVRNFNHRFLFGIGYTGIGKYKCSKNKKLNTDYNTWYGIFERAYSEEHQKRQPTYKGCTVSEEWHNFQNFAAWYEKNYIEGWFIDKDIIIKGNKIYSPETCCFVPQEINNLFTNRQNHRNNLPVGVSKNKGRYRATSTQNGRQVYFGVYGTAEEAFEAYKIGKERYIKEVADKWRGQISEKVYQAMYNYKIEITD